MKRVWVMKTKRLMTLAGLTTLMLNAFSVHGASEEDEWQFDWDWASSLESKQHQSTPLQSCASDEVELGVDTLLDVKAFRGNWQAIVALYSQSWIHQWDDKSVDEQDTEHRFVIREWVWQGEWSLFDSELDVTLGKVGVDWGIGYGYRPLDLLKPYQQNPLGLQVEEGAGTVSLSSFDMDGEWTLIYADSSWNNLDSTPFQQAHEQQGIGVRRYQLVGDSEYQWVAYYDDVRHGVLGASMVTVFGHQWEWHSSFSWQHHSLGYQFSDHILAPARLEKQGSAWQALAGFTWSNEKGHSVIGEYWFDQRAWSHRQWQDAIDWSQQLNQITTPASAKGIAASLAQGLNHTNIVQHTLLLHWSWDTQAWLQWQSDQRWHWLDKFTPTLDLLYAAQDGGMIATQWLNYQWVDTGDYSVELEFAARFFIADEDTAYGQIDEKYNMLINLKGKF